MEPGAAGRAGAGAAAANRGGGETVGHRQRLPPRNLTLLYLGFAYLSLATAFLLLATMPREIGGFFYHPRMLAVVHLVTLGWITSSILGSFYLIGPIALRTVVRATWLDYLAWLLVVVGILGMVAHFWIDSYSGMVWSAGTLLVGVAQVAARGLSLALRAPIQGGVRLHIGLAFVNLLVAGIVGMLLGIEKQGVHVLPGFVLYNVYAHAHLAALGWATMMVMGAAYRLFPMLLPAAMPKKRDVWASAVLLEAGLLGLIVALPLEAPVVVRVSVVLVLAGLAAFMAQVVWMLRHPKPSPKGLVRPDYATWHGVQATLYLVAAAALGAVMAFTGPAAWKVGAAMVYGVFGLLGFLAQMVIGVAARLLPTFAWMHAYVARDFEVVPPSQYTMHRRGVQLVGLGLWSVGVPLLAVGLYRDAWWLVSSSGMALFGALVCNAYKAARIVRHAFAE